MKTKSVCNVCGVGIGYKKPHEFKLCNTCFKEYCERNNLRSDGTAMNDHELNNLRWKGGSE